MRSLFDKCASWTIAAHFVTFGLRGFAHFVAFGLRGFTSGRGRRVRAVTGCGRFARRYARVKLPKTWQRLFSILQ
jgi:hypothetical protein